MRASSPTGVCYNTEVVVSRLAAGPPWVVGGGIYPSRGCSRRGGVRRDEGIPPYGHFIGSAYTGKSACFQRGICGRGMPLPYTPSGNDRPHGKAGCPPGGKPIVGADSISAQECLRRGGVARDDASIVPYRGVRHRRVRIFPVGRGPAVGRRGGIYPSHGCSRRRGVRRDEGIPPYGHFIGSAYTGKSACFQRGICGRGMPLPYMPSGNDRPHGKAGCPPGGKPIVGADSISARFAVRRGCPGRCKHRPLQGFVITRRLWFPGWPRACRGS